MHESEEVEEKFTAGVGGQNGGKNPDDSIHL